MKLSHAIRTVSLLEAGKGALVLLVGVSSFSLIHKDIQKFAEDLISHTHLNPASGKPRIFIELAGQLNNGYLLLLATGAIIYAGMRFIEAYGLWYQRRWAEWFAAVSCSIYIPFELFELYKHITWMSLGVLITNSAIVASMLFSLFYTQRQ